MIARVVGADRADAPRLHHWSNWIQRQFDGPSLMADRERIEQAVAEFYEWAGELIADHRAHPRDDLVSELVAAEEAGDRLSDVELVNLVLNVFVGGVDTTQSQLAQALRLFAAHPDQWALLAEDPELVGRAVDEIVRFEPITPFTARIVEEEIEFRDVTFPVGTVVMVSAWNGNRDGVDAPHEFDITAERGAAKPLTFGAGVHYCLGANLARAELEEALSFLAPRMRDLRLDGDLELGTVQGIYGVDRLPVAFTPRGRADVAVLDLDAGADRDLRRVRDDHRDRQADRGLAASAGSGCAGRGHGPGGSGTAVSPMIAAGHVVGQPRRQRLEPLELGLGARDAAEQVRRAAQRVVAVAGHDVDPASAQQLEGQSRGRRP